MRHKKLISIRRLCEWAFVIGLTFQTVACGGKIELSSSTGSFLNSGSESPPSDLLPTFGTQEMVPDTAKLGTSLFLKSFRIDNGGKKIGDFSLWTNAQLQSSQMAQFSSTARSAIILFHDYTRDALGNASALVTALKKSSLDPALENTIIFAPWFMAQTQNWPIEIKPSKPLSWTLSDYQSGGAPDQVSQLSSYAIADRILAQLANTSLFPDLTKITLIGHSGGGQTTQLYTMALSSRAHLSSFSPKISLKAVIANPSSYAYLDNQRPQGETFATLSGGTCPTYNDWKYGLENIPGLVTTEEPSTLAHAYVNFPVTYVLGKLDNDPNDRSMAQNCEAAAQGNTRLHRGRSFFSRLDAVHPENHHSLCEVSGVGHDTAAMLQSACAEQILLRD